MEMFTQGCQRKPLPYQPTSHPALFAPSSVAPGTLLQGAGMTLGHPCGTRYSWAPRQSQFSLSPTDPFSGEWEGVSSEQPGGCSPWPQPRGVCGPWKRSWHLSLGSDTGIFGPFPPPLSSPLVPSGHRWLPACRHLRPPL